MASSVTHYITDTTTKTVQYPEIRLIRPSKAPRLRYSRNHLDPPPLTSLQQQDDGSSLEADKTQSTDLVEGTTDTSTGGGLDSEITDEVNVEKGVPGKDKGKGVKRWKKTLLTGKTFTLHRVSPVHNFPTPSNSQSSSPYSSLKTSLHAYLFRRLNDDLDPTVAAAASFSTAQSTIPGLPFTTTSSSSPMTLRSVEVGEANLDLWTQNNGGTKRRPRPVVIEIQMARQGQSQVTQGKGAAASTVASPAIKALFIFLPSSSSSRRTSSYPLLLSRSPSPIPTSLHPTLLTYLQKTFDCRITPLRLRSSEISSVIERGVVGGWDGDENRPPTKGLEMSFAFPDVVRDEGLGSVALSLPCETVKGILDESRKVASDKERVDREGRKRKTRTSDKAVKDSPSEPEFLSILTSQLQTMTSISFQNLPILKASIGATAISSSSAASGPAKVKFLKGAVGDVDGGKGKEDADDGDDEDGDGREDGEEGGNDRGTVGEGEMDRVLRLLMEFAGSSSLGGRS